MSTRQQSTLFLLLFSVIILSNCHRTDQSAVNIIPKPAKLKVYRGTFTLSDSTRILAESGNGQAVYVGQYMAQRIEKASGYKLPISSTTGSKMIPGAILLTTAGADKGLGDEGYTLESNKNGVIIRGRPAGLFYGVQTFFQLLPPQIFKTDSVQTRIAWTIPAVKIKDKPRFQWRGMHLDVGRHFFPPEFIKKYIDELAMHKMNTFHWHLTEDQGWRIEIKKYPRLTKIGSWREGTTLAEINKPDVTDGIRYGGFYTQDEIREIVRYAQDRFVTIVPEIEMPGHSVAALAAYPNLSCTGGPFKVRESWGIAKDVYCAGNDSVFTFLQNVLSEVMDLFPSKYIHIGGDEVPKDRWKKCPKCQKRIKDEGLKDEKELQSYFVQRIEKFLNSSGRQIIGWDEILEGGLAPNAAVMSWRGIEGGIAAAQQNHDVVMSPTSHCYFDFYQADPADEPRAIGGFLPLEKVYAYEPVPSELTKKQSRLILGAQGNVWTEYIKTPAEVEYMALPRLCALAEVVWSPKSQRNLDDFLRRMSAHYARLDEMGVNYRWPSLKGFHARNVFIDETTVNIQKGRANSQVHFTLDGTEPTKESPIYEKPLRISQTTVLKAREVMPGGKVGKIFTGTFIKQKPLESVSPPNGQSGLNFQYFEFKQPIDSTTDLQNLAPIKSGHAAQIIFPYEKLPERFGLVFTGFIQVHADGVYTFTVLSNDGSRLYIHDQLVVDNDGWHGAQERIGQIALKSGYHPVRLAYFQAGGGKALHVYIAGPKLKKQEIPAGIFSH